MKANTFDTIKKTLKIIIFLLIITTFGILLIFSKDNKKIKVVKEFVKTGTKVLYISTDDKHSNYLENLLEKYDIEYFYINSSELSKIEKTKLEKIINSKYLSNIVVTFKDGKVTDAIIDYASETQLNEFLQKNGIIPQVMGDIKGILESANQIDFELGIIYIPYKYVTGIAEQMKILEEISKEYGATYKMIDAYLLSFIQQEKLNSIFQISSVDNQIVILIKNGKIINSIRGIKSKSEYINELYDKNFINTKENYISDINFYEFENLFNQSKKSVVIISKENCKYCSEVISLLNSISLDYNIEVFNLNIINFNNELASDVSKKLNEYGYVDGLTTPLTLLIESNKLIDYVIGPSNEEYFVEIFKENGIIK